MHFLVYIRVPFGTKRPILIDLVLCFLLLFSHYTRPFGAEGPMLMHCFSLYGQISVGYVVCFLFHCLANILFMELIFSSIVHHALTFEDEVVVLTYNLSQTVHNKWLQASSEKMINVYYATVDDFARASLQSLFILTTFVEDQLELVQVNLNCSFVLHLELGIQGEL